MRHCAIGMMALVTASAGIAQSPFTHRDGTNDGDTILPITSYPLGQSQVVASRMATALQLEWVKRDLCWQIGCLVIHNDTKFYKVSEIRIQSAGRDGEARWGSNQLQHPLLPKEKLVQLKIASADSCERDIQFVLKHRKTRERLVLESIANLCPTPHVDNIIRIDVRKPEVTVDENQVQ